MHQQHIATVGIRKLRAIPPQVQIAGEKQGEMPLRRETLFVVPGTDKETCPGAGTVKTPTGPVDVPIADDPVGWIVDGVDEHREVVGIDGGLEDQR